MFELFLFKKGMISTKCAPLALGSDLTGSIKEPAAFCGVYSIVPSPLRVSRNGVRNCFNGSDNSVIFREIAMSVGSLANNVDDLVLIS